MNRPDAEGEYYRLTVDRRLLLARVTGADGRPWFDLRLLHAVDTLAGPDETLTAPTVSIRRAAGLVIIRTEADSSRWSHRWTQLNCGPDGLSLTGGVRGSNTVLTVHAFAGYRPPAGFLPSGSALQSAFSPNPDHPRQIIRHAAEPAVISVSGSGAEPGVGRWLFTPAPWCLAVSREARVDTQIAGPGEWAWMGVVAPITEQTFTSLHFGAGAGSLALRLDYEGHTVVTDEFAVPRIDIGFGATNPYQAVEHYCTHVRAQGTAPQETAPITPWWRQPLFCGWGAQRAIAERGGGDAAAECTQSNYDVFLETLAAHRIHPGTVVIDDKWSKCYATCEPDTTKWPDLRGWIAERHAAGQRVLLWWKAWDPEGAPPQACVRMPDGTAVALDPSSAAGREVITAAVRRMLDAADLDADGLKVDFTASTPSGVALRHTGPAWGSALLHQLLAVLRQAAKAAKPDALIVTHTPNPAFGDVTDMIRLNDAVWLDAFDPRVTVTDQMTHRAKIVRAALPGRLIDTDGWYLPGRQFREYVAHQPDLGVPALYYAGAFDAAGDDMDDEDFAVVRRNWRRYRAQAALLPP